MAYVYFRDNWVMCKDLTDIIVAYCGPPGFVVNYNLNQLFEYDCKIFGELHFNGEDDPIYRILTDKYSQYLKIFGVRMTWEICFRYFYLRDQCFNEGIPCYTGDLAPPYVDELGEFPP